MIKRIKSIMSYYNLSVNAFATKIGANQVTINQQINGDRKISLDTILKIVNSFESISMVWLLTGKGFMLKEDEALDNTMFEASVQDSIVTMPREVFDQITRLTETVSSQQRTIEILSKKIN